MMRYYIWVLASLIFLSCSDQRMKGAGADSGAMQPDSIDLVSDVEEALTEAAMPLADVDVSQLDAADLASFVPDSPALDVAGGGSPDLAILNLDAQSIVDVQCDSSAESLLSFLAPSIGKSTCYRTVLAVGNTYEGLIDLNYEGQVVYIFGNPEPADSQAWIDSLAAYRWQCLAGQTIYYGCDHNSF